MPNRFAWTDLPLFVLAIAILIPLFVQLLDIVMNFASDVWEFGLWG